MRRHLDATVAAVRHEGTSVTLSVAKPLTVPSHGEPHQAPIGQADFSVNLRYTVVPRQTLNAFLEVEIGHAFRTDGTRLVDILATRETGRAPSSTFDIAADPR